MRWACQRLTDGVRGLQFCQRLAVTLLLLSARATRGTGAKQGSGELHRDADDARLPARSQCDVADLGLGRGGVQPALDPVTHEARLPPGFGALAARLRSRLQGEPRLLPPPRGR